MVITVHFHDRWTLHFRCWGFFQFCDWLTVQFLFLTQLIQKLTNDDTFFSYCWEVGILRDCMSAEHAFWLTIAIATSKWPWFSFTRDPIQLRFHRSKDNFPLNNKSRKAKYGTGCMPHGLNCNSLYEFCVFSSVRNNSVLRDSTNRNSCLQQSLAGT